MRHYRKGKCNTVEPALRATSLQQPLFLIMADKKFHTLTLCLKPLYDDHLLTMATFFGPQGDRCREVRMYVMFYNQIAKNYFKISNFFPCFQNFMMYR